MSKAFTPVFLTRDIRKIEREAMARLPPPPLMVRAGSVVAEHARDMLGERGRRVLVLAGPGNNGGDALVAARQLVEWWHEVTVVFTGREDKLSGEARAALASWRAVQGGLHDTVPARHKWDLIVDGLFGIGLDRPLDARHCELVNWSNATAMPILAIDIPSGLHADSGRVLGTAICATETLTFIGLKPGLLTLDGPDRAGAIALDTLGIDSKAFSAPHGWRIDSALLTEVLPPRLRNSHKGSFGNAGVVGGAPGMVGAALLAGRAALKLGSGRVYLGMIDESVAVDWMQPELMVRSAQAVLELDDLGCLAVGPGLGQSPTALRMLRAALTHTAPLVLDADALNLLAGHADLHPMLAQRAAPSILTPHPAEAARLLGTTTAQVQHDRIAAALALSARFGTAVVLKGNGSICALKNGAWYVNTTGNPGMAAAGMGDVLTGLIAALIAQRADPEQALLAGVHLHGLAGDRLMAGGNGPAGMSASELTDAARQVFNEARAAGFRP